jgi:alanine dehydrogenase
VDIAIDQGGCAETSHPTTHDDPVYEEEGVIHYCVANMPGAYARTATQALSNATLPYALKLANMGVEEALRRLPELRKGVNTWRGI